MCNVNVLVRTVHMRNMQCHPVCGLHGFVKNKKKILSNPTLSQRLEQREGGGMQGANHCVPCAVRAQGIKSCIEGTYICM